MDKGKSMAGRGSKSKTPLYPSDLIALGKSSRGGSTETSAESKRSSGGKPVPSHASGSGDRKREGPSLPPSVPAKKAKVSSPAGTSPRIAGGPETWEIVAMECEPIDLVPMVLDAYDQDQADKYVSHILQFYVGLGLVVDLDFNEQHGKTKTAQLLASMLPVTACRSYLLVSCI